MIDKKKIVETFNNAWGKHIEQLNSCGKLAGECTSKAERECAFYKDGVCQSPINNMKRCCVNIDISECYYKQRKVLEIENQNLKTKYEKLQHECNILDEIIELYEIRTKSIKKGDETETFAYIFDKLNNIIQKNVNRSSKYEEALKSIKETANKFNYWDNTLTDASNVINEIKDKIDEVLND